MGQVTTAFLYITTPEGPMKFLLGETLDQLYAFSSSFTEGLMDLQSGFREIGDEGFSTFRWQKGQDSQVTLTLQLSVGISTGVDTPQDLLETVRSLVICCLPNPGQGAMGKEPAPPIEIRVGNWFRRKAFVREVLVSFAKPYDVKTGIPYNATVMMSVQYIYNEMPDNTNWEWVGS